MPSEKHFTRLPQEYISYFNFVSIFFVLSNVGVSQQIGQSKTTRAWVFELISMILYLTRNFTNIFTRNKYNQMKNKRIMKDRESCASHVGRRKNKKNMKKKTYTQ